MKTLYFTVAYSPEYLTLTRQMVNSFNKFNNHEVKIFTMDDIRGALPTPDYDYTFSLTPLFLEKYIKDYDCMVRLDGDMIVTGNLDHVTEGDFDVAVTQNSNPFDWFNHFRMTGQRLSVYDTDPLDYVNCGFVVVKSKRFVNHWWKLVNTPYFNKYPFREQDMLNLLVNYFPYKVRYLDREDNNKWHGMISKGYCARSYLKDNKIIIPPIENFTDTAKEMVCFHYGGGAGGVKGKHHLLFPEQVAEYIDTLL